MPIGNPLSVATAPVLSGQMEFCGLSSQSTPQLCDKQKNAASCHCRPCPTGPSLHNRAGKPHGLVRRRATLGFHPVFNLSLSYLPKMSGTVVKSSKQN